MPRRIKKLRDDCTRIFLDCVTSFNMSLPRTLDNQKSNSFEFAISAFLGRSFPDRCSRGTKTLGTRLGNSVCVFLT